MPLSLSLIELSSAQERLYYLQLAVEHFKWFSTTNYRQGHGTGAGVFTKLPNL
jgi:hypothetical protein